MSALYIFFNQQKRGHLISWTFTTLYRIGQTAFCGTDCFCCFLCMQCICIALTGCSSPDSHDSDSGADSSVQTAQADGTRNATAQVLVPQADGIVTYGSDIVSVDASHTSDGYVMLRYTGSNERLSCR